ncbi:MULTISPECIES: hypothetical protein [unclassified Streptomyces]|uniref:hypothetical protein n=1 Tax=unclassified Streptomyces TaxID=2593676 RepID=UPI0029AF247A|nr:MULTISPECIES: hypothetical protein [unclassified Streptomyces]MDX3764831.1 hypothetical protein [Streptomyces sp. AK08-01B]MDX3814410.1 hypothetical protein [Streptomyces sp. AK08-01A]
MDVVGILEAAALLVPEGVATDNDVTVSDVWDYLAHDEWEVAFDLLEELGDGWTAPKGFWEQLERVAVMLGLERSREWCRWRGTETRVGVIRADLVLLPTGETFRRAPIPGAGVLRPMWDIGHRREGGASDLDIACVWVEFGPDLVPGARAPVRLLPLTPARWRHLIPGDRITLYETAVGGGSASILEVHPPEVQGDLTPRCLLG